ALRPGLVASPRTGRDAHRVPFLELDDLVVDLHPPAPAEDHVHLLLLLVCVAVGKAIAGRDALIAQAGFLELERLGRQAELQVRRAVEPGADVLQILLDVPERERHGAIVWHRAGHAVARQAIQLLPVHYPPWMSPPATLIMWFQLRSPELAEDFERLMAEDRDIVHGSLDTV